ncbi:hypothetical protein [Methanospirillum sp.]|uniref:hypothetical protein n=1 Tax=Methanospirillum sp. TaxID=45200 RepID=UPI001BD21158|nr:hypothetical protein [Methanospirillum sp.]
MYVWPRSTNRKADRELTAELNKSCTEISFDVILMAELSEDALFLNLKSLTKFIFFPC